MTIKPIHQLFLAFVFVFVFVGGCGSSASSNTHSSANPADELDNTLAGDDEALCPAGSFYDSVEDLCYIDCTDLTDGQCDALDESVFGDFEEYIDVEFSGSGSGEHYAESEGRLIAKYTIEDDLQLTLVQNDEPENEQKFQNIWQSVITLLPQSTLKITLSEFHINTDGEEGTLAYVNVDDDQPEKWIIAFDNADSIDDRNPEFIHTTIHEFGHLVFLANGQLNMTEMGDCPHYAIAEGCSNESSFINQYFQQFWSELFEEHQSTVGSEESEQDVTAFYEKYQDRFVSEYAATNPVEDAAEVFTRFVLTTKPAEGNSVTQLKILSLYNFNELVKLRRVIRSKLNAKR